MPFDKRVSLTCLSLFFSESGGYGGEAAAADAAARSEADDAARLQLGQGVRDAPAGPSLHHLCPKTESWRPGTRPAPT